MTSIRATPSCTLAASGFCALVVMTSCVPTQVCTLEARSSLGIRVVDEDGVGVDDATVSVVHESDAAVVCEPFGDEGGYDCQYFEAAGDFVVTVEAGAFRRSETLTVGLTDDGCHVVPEQLTFQVPNDTGCCCAFIRAGDGDIISEEPAASSAECVARDQGSCVDPEVIDQRFTPHACCPEAPGARCGD